MKTTSKLVIQDSALNHILTEQYKAQDWSIDPESEIVVGMDEAMTITLNPPIRLGKVMDAVEAETAKKNSRPAEQISLNNLVTLDSQAKKLKGPDGAVDLTDKETDILLTLHRSGTSPDPRPVPRKVLLSAALGYHAEAETHTVETHIYRLRQKLETVPSLKDLIVTEKEGYRLQT